jgi:2-oxoglutarate ferredoxin oxidoreductase subunit alpha
LGKKKLMRGSHVIAEAATRAGCRFYAGYPITPQNELPEYMSERFADIEDATFIQAESELAAINMVMGASMAPTQQDYFQATRGGGHGDYRTIVLAPYSGEELVTLTIKAFDLADTYRMPVIVLGDGLMGQMMEPVTFPDAIDPHTLPKKDWALGGAQGRDSHLIASLLLDPVKMEQHNWKLARKHATICDRETEYESYLLDDAVLAVVAFGTAARIAKGAINRVRKAGLKAGLFRPITLWPFPEKELRSLASTVKHIIVFEMNSGQMVEDVRISVGEQAAVHFHGRPGGIISTPHEIADVITKVIYRHQLCDVG